MIKRYLICYRRKSDKCCHRQAQFDTYSEVLDFIIRICKRGSKVLKLYCDNSDITDILGPNLR